MKNFKELGLDEQFVNILNNNEFYEPTEIQEKAIPVLNKNEDFIGLSQTGTGKTLAFAIPIIKKTRPERFIQSLILCPTRELAEQILLEFKKITSKLKDIRPVAVFGGADIQRQIYAIKHGANIVIGTPGRVLDHIARRTLKLGMVSTVVLDEADEMLNMGFRADIEEILNCTPKDRQTVMFSATMSKDIMALTKKYMNNPKTVQIGTPNSTIATIKQSYFICKKDKKKSLLKALLGELPKGRTIIFCNTKKMVDGIQLYLRKLGVPALALHGDMPQSVRKRVMNEYKTGESDILVTTDIAARGIDVKDIIQVINFDLPQNIEYYVHRVGRTGRAGKSGSAYTLLNTPQQLEDIQLIEKKTNSKITASTLTLNGLTETKTTYKKAKPTGKKLNIKTREKRAIIAGRQPVKKFNADITIAGRSKIGKKKKTIRQTHKSPKAKHN